MTENTVSNRFGGTNPLDNESYSFFRGNGPFNEARRMAKLLAGNSLTPAFFRGSPDNCLIAVEAACLLNTSPLRIMGNIDIIDGQPFWRTPFLVLCLENCRRFSNLRSEDCGTPGTGSQGKITKAETVSGQTLTGPAVSLDMAEEQGWTALNSNWRDMPEMMLADFAAIRFARLHAPDIFMGIRAEDERCTASSPLLAIDDRKWIDNEMNRLNLFLRQRNIPLEARQVREFLYRRNEIFNFELVKANIDYIVKSIKSENNND